MHLTRLLRTAAVAPLHAAEAAVNTTAAVVTGSVHLAASATATVAGGSMALATWPVRGAASLMSGMGDVHSLAGVAAEFAGGPRTRRYWRDNGRVWIEVRGLHDPEHEGALGTRVLSAVRTHPGVESAELNYPLSRIVVSLGNGAWSVGELCDVVAQAERASAHTGGGRSSDLPGDSEALVGRLVALAAASAGLCAALAGRAVPWARLPAGAAAAVTIVDYQPRLRQLLENRFGPSVTDTALALASASIYTATQAWASLAVDMMLYLARAAESRSQQRAWSDHEPALAAHADCAMTFSATRPRPLPPGPVERHGDRSAIAQAVGITAIGATTRNLNAAATAAVVAAPKAARTAREAFASTLTRGLADGHRVLPLRMDAVRRLDRVDAVLIDPRALSVDEVRIGRIRGALDEDRAAIWQWAQAQLELGSLTAGWNAVEGPWSTNGNGRSAVQVLMRHAHHPLASAVIGEARRSGPP